MATMCIIEGSPEYENLKTLRSIRKSRQMTCIDLGQAVGLSASMISMIERCPEGCSVRTYSALALYFGWPPCKNSRAVQNLEALQRVKNAERITDSLPQDDSDPCVNEQLTLPGTVTHEEFREFVRLGVKISQSLEDWLCVD